MEHERSELDALTGRNSERRRARRSLAHFPLAVDVIPALAAAGVAAVVACLKDGRAPPACLALRQAGFQLSMQPPLLHSAASRLRPSVSGARQTGAAGLTSAVAAANSATRRCAGLCASCPEAPSAGLAKSGMARMSASAIDLLNEAFIVISCGPETRCAEALTVCACRLRRLAFPLPSSS
jgi:hypothetical protein